MDFRLLQTANPATTTSNSLTATWGSTTHTGSLLVLLCGSSGTTETISSVTDSASNTWHQVINNNGLGGDTEVWYSSNTLPTTTVTAQYSGSTNTKSIFAREYQGIYPTGAVSGALDQNQFAATSNSTLTPTVTSGVGFEDHNLIVVVTSFTATSPTLSAGASYGNFTSQSMGANAICGVEDQVITSRQAVTGNFVGGGSSGNWSIIVAGFGIEAGNLSRRIATGAMSATEVWGTN